MKGYCGCLCYLHQNTAGQRDPEIRQAKKGDSWYFDIEDILGLIRGIVTTQANDHKPKQDNKLFHGNEECIWGDAS